MDWYGIKLLIVEQSALSRDVLHIFVGFGGQILVAALLRRTLASPLPWLAVLIGEAANEYYDLHREVWTDRAIWPGSLRDLILTMSIPTVLLLLTRFAPGLFARTPRGRRK
jgi:hypothetical protein